MTFRQFHRWVGVAAVVLFLLVSVTGVALQLQSLLGNDETAKEQLAALPSPASLGNPLPWDGVELDQARRAVLARYGSRAVASVDWAIKGAVPTFNFHLEGSEPVLVSVAASTGAILASRPDGEDWLVKLHTGEIIGDWGKVVGLLWGLGLVAMSLTGLMVYWQLLKSRKKNAALPKSGWRRYFWIAPLAAVLLGPSPARAGSPFLTDDPGFIPSGWEWKLSAVSDRNNGGRTLTAPVVDINYTVSEHFKLNLTLAGKRSDPQNGVGQSSLADTDFKFKWRFQDEGKGRPAISIAPNITIPTASRQKGLGDDVWRLRIPVQFGKTWGKWYGFAETGYQFALNHGASNAVVYGMGAQYAVTQKWTVGGEFNGSLATRDVTNYGLLANFGTAYALSDTLQIQGSVGRTVRELDRGGSSLLVQGFVQWQFL